MKKTKKAFTLIELLVVISIIAVLMAVLMPSLNKVRGQAKKVVCANNCKQLGLANILYANSNEERIVLAHSYVYVDGVRENVLWISLVRPYVGLDEVDSGGHSDGDYCKAFVCPADKTRGGMSDHGAVDLDGDTAGYPSNSANLGWVFRSYGLNRCNYYSKGTTTMSRKLTQLKQHSRLMFATETRWWALGQTGYTNYAHPYLQMEARKFDIIPTDWHYGDVNISCMDGHVETVKVSDLNMDGDQVYLWGEYYDSRYGVINK